MKKFLIALLLAVPMAMQAQKISITTSTGLKYDIECSGTVPANIIILKDSVILKMNETQDTSLPVTVAQNQDIVETPDSVNIFAEASTEEVNDSTENDSIASNFVAVAPANFVDALAQEYIPDYGKFTQEALSSNKTALEAVEEAAKPIVGEETIEQIKEIGALASAFSWLIKPVPGFEPNYAQRKIKNDNKRSYTDVKIFASMGKNFGSFFGDNDPKLSEGYGTDTDNNANYGASFQLTRQTVFGSVDANGQWVPGPLRLFWGGLAAIDFEKDLGMSADLLATGGIGIGNEVSLEVGALVGATFDSYKTFLSDDINYMTVTQRRLCFGLGVQACVSFNFSKDVYTGIWGRYVHSFKPADGNFNLEKGWEVEYDDFNQGGAKFGVFLGYKLGSPQPLSRDKRLRFTLTPGYQFAGDSKGTTIALELERQTQLSPRWCFNYGFEYSRLTVEETKPYSSFMLSSGFERKFSSLSRFSLEGKLYAGFGECNSSTVITTQTTQLEDVSPRICFKGALQLGCQYRIGKVSFLSLAFRLGHHVGRKGVVESENDVDGNGVAEGEESTSMFDILAKRGVNVLPESSNKISGWQGQASLSYKFVF